MLTELQEEKASLYALDLLDASELASFQGELQQNPALQSLVADLKLCCDVVASESLPTEAPAHLKGKILQAIKPSPVKAVKQSPAPENKLLQFPSFIPWALAACLTLSTAWLVHDREAITAKLVLLETDLLNQKNAIALLQSRNVLQASTIAQLKATSAETNPWSASTVSVAWNKDTQEGILVLAGMPEAEAGKTYQLWIIDSESKAPVSAGVFLVATEGGARITFKPTQKISKAAQFAISVESGGENPQPLGPIILAGASL